MTAPASRPSPRPIALITGASSGIGEATARALSRRGYALVLSARRLERLEALAAELSAAGPVWVIQADVALSADRTRLVAEALAHAGRIDALINNAGISLDGAWWKDSDPLRLLRVNLDAPIELTRLLLPVMLARRSGQIVNVASVAGHIASEGLYSASKFGLRGFSLGLRRQLRGSGVNVSLVSPGFVRSEMTVNVKSPIPGLPIPGAEIVARAIAEVLERPERERIVPGWYRLPAFLDRVAPGVIDGVLRLLRV
jgi:short-subunit dehydrogenase